MSTDLITYLNFISGLKYATDDELSDIISERQQFILLGTSDMMTKADSAIDAVFDRIDELAKQLEEEEIADESVKLAEDAAAVGAIWSFGLSMAVFLPLAATDAALQVEIKKKEDDLNDHLESADKDIGEKMGGSCKEYVTLFKKNNNYIQASSPAGLTAQTARSYLYNYMDFLSTHGGLGLDNFKKYIEAARLTLDDPNITKIYDILDEFTLSDSQGKEEIQKALEQINESGLGSGSEGVDKILMIRGLTYLVWIQRMKVSAKTLKEAAEDVDGIPPEETELAVFKNMDNLGKVAAGLTIMISIIDAALNAYEIAETVDRYNENIKVFNNARGQYKDYYKNLYDASVAYNPPQ